MVLLSGQSYAPFIFTGGVDDAVTAHIAGASDPVVGFNNYCTSGRTTGNNCSGGTSYAEKYSRVAARYGVSIVT